MSTLNVATVKSLNTLPPAVQNSSGTEIGTFCRAWVNFNGTTVTSPASMTGVRGSFNVSSVLDNGTGDYTVNFTTAMPDTNYAAIVTAGEGAAGASSLNRYGNVGVYSTTSCKVFTGPPTSTALDVSFVNFSVFR